MGFTAIYYIEGKRDNDSKEKENKKIFGLQKKAGETTNSSFSGGYMNHISGKMTDAEIEDYVEK